MLTTATVSTTAAPAKGDRCDFFCTFPLCATLLCPSRFLKEA